MFNNIIAQFDSPSFKVWYPLVTSLSFSNMKYSFIKLQGVLKLWLFIPALIITILLMVVIVKQAGATELFETSANVEYKIYETGSTTVTNTVTITNKSSIYFPKKYVFKVKGLVPENVKAYEAGSVLKTEVVRKDGMTAITVIFNNSTLGKNNTKTFVLTYQDKTFTKKNGEIWEVYIPRLDSNETFDSYKIALSIPGSFGEEAFITPEPIETKKIEDRRIYYFDKSKVVKNGVTAGFGIFQVYSFSLGYHVENYSNKTQITEIAIPPDTSTQSVFYDSLDPKPLNVNVDPDGNWLAQYLLKPKQILNINVKGNVQIYANPRNYLNFDDKKSVGNLTSNAYWQSDNENIINIAKSLKDTHAIYDYVINKLKYNQDRLIKTPKRLGAVKALETPEDALCSEFTDLFIAIARAKGIPAREINGFAYSQNPALEPLSLVKDVLHSWPEYWDQEKNHWIPIDPTWAATTGGEDFFNKFDLRHFAFVIHGLDPVKPVSAGSYKLDAESRKDIYVNFGTLPEKKYSDMDLSYKLNTTLPLSTRRLNISISNIGPAALYNQKIMLVTNEGIVKSEENIGVLPPLSTYNTQMKLNYGFLGKNIPENLKIVTPMKEVSFSTNRIGLIFSQLIVFFAVLIFFVLIFLVRIQKRSLFKILSIFRK